MHNNTLHNDEDDVPAQGDLPREHLPGPPELDHPREEPYPEWRAYIHQLTHPVIPPRLSTDQSGNRTEQGTEEEWVFNPRWSDSTTLGWGWYNTPLRASTITPSRSVIEPYNDIKVDLILKYMNRLDKAGWEYALDHIIECEMSFPGKDPNGFFRARVESEGKAATVQAWMVCMNLRTFIGPGVIPQPNDFERYGRIVKEDMEEARWNHFKDWVKWSENVLIYAGFDERGAVHEVMEGLRTQSVMRWICTGFPRWSDSTTLGLDWYNTTLRAPTITPSRSVIEPYNDIKVDLILKYMNRLDKDGWEYALDHIIECEMSFPGKDPNGFFRARVESEGKAATVQAWMIHMNLRTFIGPGVIPHPNDFESYGRIVRKDMEEARWNHFKDWVKWSENVISYAGFDERGAVHEVMEALRTQSVMRWIRAG